MTSEILSLYTIHERPKDYPEGFVVRRSEINPACYEPIICEAQYGPTLESVRAKLPPGLVRIARHPKDEPQIVEVWL